MSLANTPSSPAPSQRVRSSSEGADALHQLGNALREAGRPEEALVQFRLALQLEPDAARIHHSLGLALDQLGRWLDAADAYRQALQRQPDYASAHNNFGTALLKLHKLHEAITQFHACLRLQPTCVEAHNNLGIALSELNQHEKALPSFHAALALRPDSLQSHLGLGAALGELGRVEEAIRHITEALRLKPAAANIHNDLGIAHASLNRFDEALAHFERALQLQPDYPLTQRNRALTWLKQGDLARGWPSYEQRLLLSEEPRSFAQPRWDGSPLAGRTILVHHEQGLGDTLQFVRYLPLLQQQGGRVIFECQKGLTRLLASCRGIDVLLPSKAPLPPFDVHAAIMSLPYLLGTTLETIPAPVPYLYADAALVRLWGQVLGRLSGFKVAIAWQGNPRFKRDRLRSIPLRAFAPLARLPGVRLLSLQKWHGVEQIAIAGFPVLDVTKDLDTHGAFTDTAAILKNVDLVITSDSALAHLAGALDVPVWLALGFSSDWRWLMDRADSPWYPSMRLFRQQENDNWTAVFTRMAEALKGRIRRHFASATIGMAAASETDEVHPDLAARLLQVGQALEQVAQPEEALELLRAAVVLNPDNGEIPFRIGNNLRQAGQLEEATASYRESIRLQPQVASVWLNLGATLASLERFEEAEAAYRSGLHCRPDDANLHNNLGVALKNQLRLPEALACFEEALRLSPEHVEAHRNRGLTWLLLGELERGLAENEWRLRRPDRPQLRFTQPRWDGSPLAGRTILLHPEQGIGDTIQFVRYAPLLQAQGGRVLLLCPPTLLPLLRACPGIDQLIPHGADGTRTPPFDVHASLVSLPLLLGTTMQTIPAPVPYLRADAELVQRWGTLLRRVDGFKVGIGWQGNPDYVADRGRSFPLTCFAPLARLPHVQLVSLQKGPGVEQLAGNAVDFPILSFDRQADEAAGAFMDTAAIVAHLDLVITSDTALAHLAGALGVPVWVVLPLVPDWRWFLDRADSPWYPNMRLFRQRQRGDWAEVFQRVAGALQQRLQDWSSRAPITVPIAPGELIDKITILQIKSARISDPGQLHNVQYELELLLATQGRSCAPSEELTRLTADLRAVNESLWQIEDDIRRCEAASDFGERFIELARSVYRENDRRARLKRQINEVLGSKIMEEKSYANWQTRG